MHGTTIHLPRPASDDLAADLDRMLAQLPVTDLQTVSPTIEDAFVW